MKFHLHVGVIETEDARLLDEALTLADCADRVLARPEPNLAVLERSDIERVREALTNRGIHPKVME